MKYLCAAALILVSLTHWSIGLACGGGYVLDGTVIETGYGIVISVDQKNETVNLDHEAIPYILNKGKASFAVVGPKVLEEAVAARGVRVMFDIRISKGDTVITHIEPKKQ